MRHDIAACGRLVGLADHDHDALVSATYEAASNAVRHGGGHGHLHVWLYVRALYCQISDRGTGFDATLATAAAPPPDAVGGRGLWLIHQICKAVQIHSDSHGTRIVMRFPAPAGQCAKDPAEPQGPPRG